MDINSQINRIGASIIGNVEIGDNCAIGANAVVIKSLLPFTFYALQPGMVLFKIGSSGYVINIGYHEF